MLFKRKKVFTTKTKPYGSWLAFIVALIALFGLGSILYFLSPEEPLQIFSYSIPTIPLFLLALFCFLLCLVLAIFKSKKHGFMVAGFTVIYSLFRLNDLTHPFFLILLIALFLTLELFFGYNKRDNNKLV